MFFSEEELAANERLKEDAESCGGTGSPYGYGQKFRGWLNKDLLTVTAAVLREAAREGRETRRPKRVKLPRGRMAAISMGGQVGAARVVTIRGRAVVEFELPAGVNVIAVPDDKHLTARTLEK